MNNVELFVHVLHDGFFGALASLGFAILFNVPRHTLIGCALSGGIAISIRTLLVSAGMGIELSTLIGATFVGFWGLYFKNHFHVPAPIFTVTGSIPLVPGTFAFKAMIGMVTLAVEPSVDPQVLVDAWRDLIKTALILGAIALGIAAPSLLFKRFRMQY